MKERNKLNIAYADLGAANPRGPYAGITLFRDIVPLTLGVTTKGNLALRAFDSYRGEYRLFLIEHIGRVQNTGEIFSERNYPEYSGSDKMLQIQHTVSRMKRTVGKSKIGKALGLLRR